MKLIDALEILRTEPAAGAGSFRVSLVCGFTPLHLQTFLAAQLRLALPAQQIKMSTGLYGDFWGNLRKAHQEKADAVVIIMEWADLDGRLGARNLGSWAPSAMEDILRNAKNHASKFIEDVTAIAQETRVSVCMPSLPLAPLAFQTPARSSEFELAMRSLEASMSLEVSRLAKVRVVSQPALDLISPLASRADLKAELTSGFPYKLPHASATAKLLAQLVQPGVPKKGLITDLDDTLWSGILGDDGADGVSWDLEHHSHMHGAYQRMLHALSETGVLIGVASKNDKKFVEEVLQREDLVLPQDAIFPLEAHWGPKSGSVARILKAWNIGADAVVFIDDSPIELAEVKAAHPEVECILFPKDDYAAIQDLFYRLRSLFGKDALSEEDSIRRESIRRAPVHAVDEGAGSLASEEFLKQAEAEITFSATKEPLDPRALELVNKTNQFNLNGKRYTEAAWQGLIEDPEALLMVVSYKDKYGPLGKIAVLAGRKVGDVFFLDTWVMSCRAFSRRIEHHSLEDLFARTGASEIVLDFESTPKNGPLRDFLSELLGEPARPAHQLSREQFMKWTGSTQPDLEAVHG